MKRSSASRDNLEQRALLATRTLVDNMRALYRALEQTTGAPIAAHRVLACVGSQPGISASQLATALGMQRPALSQALKMLAARGWIERTRSATDQRSVQVFVTAEGARLLKATSGRAAGTLQRAVRRLSDREVAELASGLEALLGQLPATLPNKKGTPTRVRSEA